MKNILKHILLSLKKGWNTPTLLDSILKIESNPITRLFRVIGGISTGILLGKKYLDLHQNILIICIIISSMFFIYLMILFAFRVIHILKTLKSDKLDIKNSPLDKWGTLAIINNNKKFEIVGSQEQTSQVVKELNISNPDWANGFINSPIELGELSGSTKSIVIDLLTSNLTLHFITLYLMVMFLLIFTSKLIIDNNIQLDFIKNYPLGKHLYFAVNKYVSFWTTTANLWLYFIMFSLFIFTSASTFSIYQILTILN